MRRQCCESGRPSFIGALRRYRSPSDTCRTFYQRGSTKAGRGPIPPPIPHQQQRHAAVPATYSTLQQLPLHTSATRTLSPPSQLRAAATFYSTTSTRNSNTSPSLATRRKNPPRYSAVQTYITSRSSSTTTATMSQGEEWTGVKVRQTFFNFFQERGHTIGMHNPDTAPAIPYNTIHAAPPMLDARCSRFVVRASCCSFFASRVATTTDSMPNLQSRLPRSSLIMTPPSSSPMPV